MKELEIIYDGLVGCNTLLMKAKGQALECSFIKRGIVRKTIMVHDQLLADALTQKASNGILEGMDLQLFRNTFYSFCIHIQSRKLVLDLNFTLKRIEQRQEEVIAA